MEPNEKVNATAQTEIKKECENCVNCQYDTFCGYNALHCNIHGALETIPVEQLSEKAKSCPDFKPKEEIKTNTTSETRDPHDSRYQNTAPVAAKPKLTYDTLDLPTYEEALEKTFPDYDDFECLRGKMGASGELIKFTKVIYYKVKLDPPENDRDYFIKELPVYPKFLELFEGKKSVSEITLFDVNRMFSKEKFEKALEEDERYNAIADAAAEIMQNMKKENRFAFNAELKESDIEILKKHIKDTDGFTNYGDLLTDSFREMLPDFDQFGESGVQLDFNAIPEMFSWAMLPTKVMKVKNRNLCSTHSPRITVPKSEAADLCLPPKHGMLKKAN